MPPGTPRVPMAESYRSDYYRYIAKGYPHWQAEWLADCDAVRRLIEQRNLMPAHPAA